MQERDDPYIERLHWHRPDKSQVSLYFHNRAQLPGQFYRECEYHQPEAT